MTMTVESSTKIRVHNRLGGYRGETRH